MKYSKLLNLGEILGEGSPTHVIMRRPDIFPNYEAGTDIDLLVMDMDRMIDYLSRHLPNYTRYVISDSHVQIDHWAAPKQLDLKFDLYSYHISSMFTKELLARSQDIRIGATKHLIPIPFMENLLKCYEYVENGKNKYVQFAKYEPLLKPYL